MFFLKTNVIEIILEKKNYIDQCGTDKNNQGSIKEKTKSWKSKALYTKRDLTLHSLTLILLPSQVMKRQRALSFVIVSSSSTTY